MIIDAKNGLSGLAPLEGKLISYFAGQLFFKDCYKNTVLSQRLSVDNNKKNEHFNVHAICHCFRI